MRKLIYAIITAILIVLAYPIDGNELNNLKGEKMPYSPR